MTLKEIKELLSLVSELDLKEVNIKNNDFSIKIRTDKDQGAVMTSVPAMMQSVPPVMTAPIPSSPAPAAPAAGGPAPAAPATSADDNYVTIKSPMVGTFYRSASPDKPAYVQVGDSIGKGSVLCIIEAMKLFNEIESEVSGKIVKVLVDDSSPVEYDQALFLVDPNG